MPSSPSPNRAPRTSNPVDRKGDVMVQLARSHLSISGDAGERELQDLLAQLVESVAAHATLAPDMVAKLIAIAPSELTELARSASGDAPDAVSVQMFLRELVHLLATMKTLTGSVRIAADWLRDAQIREFDGAVPLRIVAAGRASDVCRLMDMYDAGPAG